MEKKVTNVILVGVGGQGIILASEVLAEVALDAGFEVKKSEVHGMAQRGGSVSSHVRVGTEVNSPLIEIGKADIMLAFEKVEGMRSIDFLAPEAAIIMNDAEIIPPTVSFGMGTYPEQVEKNVGALGYRLTMIKARELAEKAGTFKAANIVLLAALASRLDIERGLWEDVVKRRVPKKFIDVNMEAFRLGYEASGGK